MKKLMKLMIALLVLVMAVSMTGCGRGEEKVERDTGTGLVHRQTVAEKKDTEALLNEMAQAYEVYTTATEGDEIIAAAEKFNRLYEVCMEQAEEEDRVRAVTDWLLRNLGRRYRIKEGIYRGKAALAEANMCADWEEVHFYFHPKNGDSKFVGIRYDEAGQKQIVALKQDGSVYSPDLSKILAMNPSIYDPVVPTQDSLVVEVVVNADWIKYEFPLNNPVATGEQIPFDQPQTEYICWQVWEMDMAQFSHVEAREALGEMFEK